MAGLVFLFSWGALAGDFGNASTSVTDFKRGGEPIRPIPQTLSLDARKVSLGQKLFNDPILSHDNTISCASCHNLAKGGTDHHVHSFGINQTEGDINAPTVFNSGLHFKQFWDGRASTLEDQIDGPVAADNEMRSQWMEVLSKLRGSTDYPSLFKQIYPDGLETRNVKDAIAEFERSLITPNSRFDRFLRGEKNAITQEELEGYHKFKAFGCITCHQGVAVGGNMFQPLGVMGDFFANRKVTKADLGRFNVTGNEDDKFVFKVPSLRNVELTAPYFHDGSAKTLEEAVTTMATYQLGRDLSEEDIGQIVSFLKSLTGEYNGKALR